MRFLHTYRTDQSGLTDQVEVRQVKLYTGADAGQRRRKKPKGKPNYGTWHRGHLVAAEFGAAMELINLAWMARATNQGRSAARASGDGNQEVASLIDRFSNPGSLFGGSLDEKGEWKVPAYRAVERGVRELASLAASRSESISIQVTLERNPPSDRMFYRVWVVSPSGRSLAEFRCVVAHF
ncbi:hypothetical protein GCM10023339_41430 [Alloalcanivorax gelatiniphagus]